MRTSRRLDLARKSEMEEGEVKKKEAACTSRLLLVRWLREEETGYKKKEKWLGGSCPYIGKGVG